MAVRCTCCETCSSASSCRRCSKNSTSSSIAATPNSRQSRTIIDIKAVYSSDAFSLGGGPSSAIACTSSIAEYRAPAHGISPYRRTPPWRPPSGADSARCRRSRAARLADAAKTLNVPPPRRARIKFNADGSRPRADDRAAGARLGCARRAHSRRVARGAARALRAARLARAGVRRLRDPPAVRQAHAAADAGRAASCRRWRCAAASRCSRSAPARAIVSACLAQLGGRVRSLELHPEIADLARANLRAAAPELPIEVIERRRACSWPRNRATTSSC